MDKQIIIDGVDVSGCSERSMCINCETVTNCYYKQLKRKEQECSEYSKELARFQQEVVPKLRKRLRNKEQECEELKKQLTAYIKEAEENFEVYTTLKDNYRKLYQTLTDIKEIAEICIKQDICTTCDNSDKCYIENEEIPTYDVCKLILQKISECEGNDE